MQPGHIADTGPIVSIAQSPFLRKPGQVLRGLLSLPTGCSPEGEYYVHSLLHSAPTPHLFRLLSLALSFTLASAVTSTSPPLWWITGVILRATLEVRLSVVTGSSRVHPRGPHILLPLPHLFLLTTPLTFVHLSHHTGLFCCCGAYSSSSGALFPRELEVAHPTLHNFHNLKRDRSDDTTTKESPPPAHFKCEACLALEDFVTVSRAPNPIQVWLCASFRMGETKSGPGVHGLRSSSVENGGDRGGSRRKTKHSAETVRLGFFCTHRCYFHERVLYLLLFRWDKESELALLSEIYAACFPSPPGLILSSSLDFESFFFLLAQRWLCHISPLFLLSSSFLRSPQILLPTPKGCCTDQEEGDKYTWFLSHFLPSVEPPWYSHLRSNNENRPLKFRRLLP